MSGEPKGPLSVDGLRDTIRGIVPVMATESMMPVVVERLAHTLAPLIAAERAAGMVMIRERAAHMYDDPFPSTILTVNVASEIRCLPIPGESALRELVERAMVAIEEYEKEYGRHLDGLRDKPMFPTPESVIADWVKGRRA